MSTMKNNIAPRRARASARSKRLPSTYIALHTTQLARCLAHGLLFLAVRSIIQPFAAPATAESLECARQGLDYGNVVLVEFEPDKFGFHETQDSQSAASGQYREVPLAWARRVVFRTSADKTEFLARVGAYADVPLDALEYEVDETLFSDNSLLDEIVGAGDSGHVSDAELHVGTTIEKIAGVVAAVLASFRQAEATEKLVDALNAACGGAAVKGSPATLVGEFARAIDIVPSSKLGNDLVCIAATMLAAPGNNTGFDVDTFLAELCASANADGLDVEMVGKFDVRAAAVLSGATELRDDAFTDTEGKVALRALLLFMLNPEVEALQKIRTRMVNIGQKVFSLAYALAGCHAGIARLGVSIKAPNRTVFLGTTFLAWEIFFRQPLTLEQYSAWTLAGTSENTLSAAGYPLVSIVSPVQKQLIRLKTALASMGIDAGFEIDTGALAWPTGTAGSTEFFAFPSTSPTLPRVEAIDICIHVEQKMLAKGSARAAADASLIARESGVFARQSTRGKNKGIELRICCIAEHISPATIDAASDALQAQAERYQESAIEGNGNSKVPSEQALSPAPIETEVVVE